MYWLSLQQLHVLYSMVMKYLCWNGNVIVITNDHPLTYNHVISLKCWVAIEICFSMTEIYTMWCNQVSVIKNEN